MMPLPYFQHSTTKGKVCRLKKELYVLKPSPRAWFESFHNTMIEYGNKRSQVIILYLSSMKATVLKLL